MLRTLRGLLADYGLDRFVRASEVLRLARLRIEAELPDDPPFRGLTPVLVDQIAEAFSSSNDLFVRDYLGGRHAGLFEPPAQVAPATARWSRHEAPAGELRLSRASWRTPYRLPAPRGELAWPRFVRPAAREAVARSIADWAGGGVDLLRCRLPSTRDAHKRD